MIRRWLRLGLAALLLTCRPAAADPLHANGTFEVRVPQLTAAQKATLARHPVLRLGVESDWEPIEFIDANGAYSGVISSYMRVIENELGIKFEIVRKDSFDEVLQAFNRGEIDVLSALGRTDAREPSMRFTDPYITFTDGLIVRTTEPYVERLQDFADGKRLAVVQGYGSNERAAVNHPQLVVVPVRTTEEALFAVSTGRADIAIASLAAAYHLTQNRGFTNLRVAANFDEFEQQMGMAVRPDLEELIPLFNLVLKNIPDVTRDAMRGQWTQVQVDRGVARSTVLFWSLLGLVLLLVMAAWVLLLLSQQRQRSRLLSRTEEAEAQLRAIIEAMPALFWVLRVEPGRPARFTFLGERAMKIAGIKAGESSLAFSEIDRLMPPEDRQRLQQAIDQHSQSFTPFRLEHRLLTPDGSERGWVHVQAVPVREKTDVVWYGCSLDITERKTLEVELEKSRNQLQELAAGVPGALWQFRKERDGRQSYSYMSDGIVGITGRTPAETNQLMQDKSFVSVHPDDLPVLQGLMQRLTERPSIDEARYRLRTVDGGWRWVQVAAQAMPIGPDGALVWNGLTLDATSAHETEQALRLERQRLQDLADSFAGALWRTRRLADGSYRVEYVSEGIVKMTGRSAADIMAGRVDPSENIVPEDLPRIMAAADASAASGRPLEIEYSVRAACGSVERLFARASVREVDGQPVWTGVLLNVTDRYRMAQQLADVRGRIADIAANFPGAIFQLLRGPDGITRFTYISEGITALTGRPPRTVDGREKMEDYGNIHPEDRELVDAASQKIIHDSGSVQLDYRLLDVNGLPRWVHCAMTARRQQDGSTVINGLLLDSEEAKRLEAELRKAHDRAETASRAKGQFLANMSHEIRTPMNAVIGLAHIAMTSETNPVQQERIGKIHRAGKALLKLLNDILEYSRLDAGKFTPVLAVFDLKEMKESLRLFCSTAAETKALAFVIDCDEQQTPRHWTGDATRIQQVLLNLLTNAIKFTDSGSVTLAIRVLPGNAGLHFMVRDTGIGMNEAVLKRVFEAFEQASGETERRHGGSGLGLSITRELVTALGGQLKVESTPGQGTTFSFDMPLKLSTPAPRAAYLTNEMAPRLTRLAEQLGQRDAVGARNSLTALRMLLIPLGREQELHSLERLLASFDIEGAQVELAQLTARWGKGAATP